MAVPEQVAIVGIDNDSLTHSLTRISLCSVRQGTHEMGRIAARLLQRMLHGARLAGQRFVVPPAGLNVQASCRHTRPFSSHVMKARYFIRKYGCRASRTNRLPTTWACHVRRSSTAFASSSTAPGTRSCCVTVCKLSASCSATRLLRSRRSPTVAASVRCSTSMPCSRGNSAPVLRLFGASCSPAESQQAAGHEAWAANRSDALQSDWPLCGNARRARRRLDRPSAPRHTSRNDERSRLADSRRQT